MLNPHFLLAQYSSYHSGTSGYHLTWKSLTNPLKSIMDLSLMIYLWNITLFHSLSFSKYCYFINSKVHIFSNSNISELGMSYNWWFLTTAASWLQLWWGVLWEQHRLLTAQTRPQTLWGRHKIHDLWLLSKNFLLTLSSSIRFAESMSLARRNLSQ